MIGAADTDPIVWDNAHGTNVIDADGNRFVDLTAGFGVASVGHGHPDVVAAQQQQGARLLHAMGDAFPDPKRIALMERLCTLTGMDRVILGSSGSDAVEAALKTARIATGKDHVLTFQGGYHGLSLGALPVSDYKHETFRKPFAGQLGAHVQTAPFSGAIPDLKDVGAVIVEPIQGRGGIRMPEKGWLSKLADAAKDAGAVLIFDEIYTGCGRTGSWFRFVEEGVKPDLVCLGKGMAGGFPISACVGTANVMDAWGASQGEAVHTQTFLGNPVGSAMALACLDVIASVLPDIGIKESWIRQHCEQRDIGLRGAGLLLGMELPNPMGICRQLLQRGYIALPAGMAETKNGRPGEVVALTPPFVITKGQIDGFFDALDEIRS